MNAANAHPLLTIADIALRTGLEESLLRFYESEYPNALPTKVLRGDALLFPEEAVAAFQRLHRRQAPQQAPQPPDRPRYGRVIAITSGKGGVGKTNIALNLAIAIQRLGKMCVVVDGDLGMANIHLLAGLPPRPGMTELLAADARPSELIGEGPEGIGIITGGSGIIALADSDQATRRRMIKALAEVERQADVLIVDTGAGMGRGVRDFLQAADEILFVITPDITSLADAYGLLKGIDQERGGDDRRPIYSVVNMADTLQQAANVALRFSDCAHRFLGRSVKNIGYILKDATVGAATARRTPYSVFRPQSRVSKHTHNLAVALLRDEMDELRISSAFGRYRKMLDNGGQP
ncbi:MAG: AAA family ATPase [Desulfobulbaceae bacterium]|nr:AAA family ATPase [Desulfobulbaceae bacterium]